MRSELFAAALQLHEAWLAEVLHNEQFKENLKAICDLLSGERLKNSEHALAIWQGLFMVVPVISSAFASIASQFRDIGSNALGWLFIDEAGQAVPQHAVGALWRCKRGVIVGDPLQIEPVFTVPIKLIEALFSNSGLSEGVKVMPHKVSVQNLADEANPLGTGIKTGNKEQWIGSPLRVHRRCADPMFTIANEIAYNNKMIYGLEDFNPSSGTIDLGKSAWVSVSGTASDKQLVPAQIELVFQALVMLCQSCLKLPPLYIISPFKRIKAALLDELNDTVRWRQMVGESGYVPLKKELDEWCSKHVGTVHTFQGKEESIVWMVLGCDGKSKGAVSWASDKPNLLNVALTRAQHRFFMIGDDELWGSKGYFCKARESFESIISSEDFLRRIKNLALSNCN